MHKQTFISAGFDAAEGTPEHVGGFHVTPAGYAEMTRLLLDGLPQTPLAVVLEGGYDLPSLAACATAVLTTQVHDNVEEPASTLKKEKRSTKLYDSVTTDQAHCDAVIDAIAAYHALQGWSLMTETEQQEPEH